MKKKYLFSLIGVFLLLTAGVLAGILTHYFFPARETKLYKLETSYRLEHEKLPDTQELFTEGSGEYYFLEGLRAFDLGNYQIAKEFFQKAMENSGSDRALPAYLYFYLNQCQAVLEGVGDENLVAKAMEEALKYAPLANDTDYLLHLIYSISGDSLSDKKAIELMNAYIQDQKHLQLLTWARIKNEIAIMEYDNEEYADSIRDFYDVEIQLGNRKLTAELRYEYMYAKEYIANIYYFFENYDKAVLLYREIADAMGEEGIVEYSVYVNMADAYTRLKDTQNAKKTLQKLQDNLDKINDELVPEIKAVIDEELSNIYLAEKDYAKAKEHLENAEAYFEENTEEKAFWGSRYYVLISRCRYMEAIGQYQEMLELLEEFVTTKEAKEFGFEKDCYEILAKVYAETGQEEKQIDIYEKLLEIDKKFIQDIGKECFEFLDDYRVNGLLTESNLKFYFMNVVMTIAVIFVLVVLVIVLFVLHTLYYKNITDQLTGVYNRKKLNQLIKKYERRGTPSEFGVVMMDIDYFKRYNDTYGHQAGDVVLTEVAKILKTSVRKKDIVIRYGGEEFLILINRVTWQTAEEVCFRIQAALKEKALEHIASEVSSCVTISMGMCYQKEKNEKNLERLIGCADEYLYQSKETGRNKLTSGSGAA